MLSRGQRLARHPRFSCSGKTSARFDRHGAIEQTVIFSLRHRHSHVTPQTRRGSVVPWSWSRSEPARGMPPMVVRVTP